MIQNTSFEASDLFFCGGGGAGPRTPLDHTRLTVVFINSWKNRRRTPPPPPVCQFMDPQLGIIYST